MSVIPQGEILGTAVIGPAIEVQCMEQTEMPPPPIPPRRTTRSTSGTRDQNCLNLSFSTLTFWTLFFNKCNSSGFRRKMYDSWDEATASTSKDEHPPKLRRSTRVAAAEAKEKMSFTEEMSSKFSQIKMDYSLPPSLTPKC